MNNEQCQKCKKHFEDDMLYEYRGFIFCEQHFDEGIEIVDTKRKEVMEVTAHSVKSQANGEWANGSYKKMATDVAGNPIPTKVKEPQILKDYESSIL